MVIPMVRRADFWSGLVLAALGVYIVAEARRWVYLGPDGPGAGFFPLGYGVAMMVLSAILVVRSVLDQGTGGTRIAWAGVRRALACWLALVAAVGLLKIVGFLASFALLTWFLVAVMFRRPQRVALPIAIGGAAMFYVLFAVALGVALPVGPWGF